MERKTLSKESLDEVHHILVAVQLPMFLEERFAPTQPDHALTLAVIWPA